MSTNATHTSSDASSAEARLMASALSLFAEKGYDGTSIREIIENAGVTRPVLYYYFKNKEDLFCRLVDRSFAEFAANLDQIKALETSCRSRLKALMRLAFRQTEESPGTVRLVLQVLFSGPQAGVRLKSAALAELRLGRILDLIREGLRTGELAGGDAVTMTLAFSGIMDMHILAKVYRPEARLTDELADGLVDLFMDGASLDGDTREPVSSPFTRSEAGRLGS